MVDAVVIPRVHPQVIRAIHQVLEPADTGALGVMEFFSVTAAVYGADSAVKAAQVDLLDLRLGTGIGGKSVVVLCGDVAAVEAAVAAGRSQAETQGLVVACVVIPNPRPAVFDSLM